MRISITIDVEKDLHLQSYRGLEKGIPKLLLLLDKHVIKATFFVPAKLIELFPEYFIALKRQGHEIALHGYKHERFDDLPLNEKQRRISESVKIYQETFKEHPKGFRAPQHSIDKETLKILEKENLIYDSSETPLNLLQLLFFPGKFSLWAKSFFSKRDIHKIGNLHEIPTSSFLIPFVSLPMRAFPWPFLKMYLNILSLTNKQLIFYAHSWDLIKLEKSRIDRTFSHKKLLDNLSKTIDYLSKKNKFVTMEEFIK